jgi:CBS domain
MTQRMLVVLLMLGSVLAIASVLLRVFTAGEYEVKTIDLIFLVIPLLLVALATGKLRSLDLFGLKADFSDLWAAVGQSEIRNQVSEPTPLTRQDTLGVQDDLEVLEIAEKSRPEDLPQLIGRQLEALEFKLGHGGYRQEAIAKYFEALSGSLRVVVVNDQEGKLFAIYNAPDLISLLRFTEGGEGYRQLEELLNRGDEKAQSDLAQLPGFVGAHNAVTESTSKRDALARMEELNTDILPVVNEEGRFIGTVGRSKLTAGLILAVTDELEGR